MSLLFNMLSKLVIAFLQRSKCLLISWLQSPSIVIIEPKIIVSVSTSICHEVMGLDVMIEFTVIIQRPQVYLYTFLYLCPKVFVVIIGIDDLSWPYSILARIRSPPTFPFTRWCSLSKSREFYDLASFSLFSLKSLPQFHFNRE